MWFNMMIKMLCRSYFAIAIVFSTYNSVSSTNDGIDVQLNLRDLAKEIVPRLREHDPELESVIETVILQLRNESAIEIPGVEIPDPMRIPDFNLTVNQRVTSADVQLWNVSISGISQVILDEVSANLGEQEISIGLNITEIMIRGQYNLKGKVIVVRVSGQGDFWMSVKDAFVTGNLFLGVNDKGILEVTDINMDLTVRHMQLHFENLFGNLSKVSNAILNAISPSIFNSIKPTLLDEMQTTLTRLLNERFQRFPPQHARNDTQNPLDRAIEDTAVQMRAKGLDPLRLPSQKRQFNKRFWFMRVYGNMSLHDGYLRGLSSIHRTGDVLLSYKNNYANATAQIGFQDLRGGYKWNAHFMGISRQGDAQFAVKQIHSLVSFAQVNRKDSHPVVTQFKITQIELIDVDINGLGSFDYLLEFFSNFFTNAFKKQFSRILQTQVREILQENLKQFKIPF